MGYAVKLQKGGKVKSKILGNNVLMSEYSSLYNVPYADGFVLENKPFTVYAIIPWDSISEAQVVKTLGTGIAFNRPGSAYWYYITFYATYMKCSGYSGAWYSYTRATVYWYDIDTSEVPPS